MGKTLNSIRNLVLISGLLAGAVTVAGCDEGGVTPPGTCGLDFATRVDSTFGNEQIDHLLEAAATFNVTAVALDQDVRGACNAIATDLGAATSTDTQMACNNASTAIQAILDANAMATVLIEVIPAVCTVSADAVATCAAECDASFDVTMTPITCEGGMLSGGCSGRCEGSCTVEGDVMCTGSCSGTCSGTCMATAEGTCTGTCNGRCEGTCSAMDADGNCMGDCTGTCRGTCMGTIEGSCSGECMGMCMGSCRSTLTGSCSGSCTGMCDVAFTAPRCEGGEVNVMADADCSASCEADASFDATCTDPEVVFTFTGAATTVEDLDRLAATLRANLPTLLAAIGKGQVMASAAVEFGTQLTGAVSAATSTSLEAADCVRRAIQIQLEAVTSVNVSIMASVSVNATATGSI